MRARNEIEQQRRYTEREMQERLHRHGEELRFEVQVEALLEAMEHVIRGWPREHNANGFGVQGTVSSEQRAWLYERYGQQLREVRRLWKQIDYRMKSGEPFTGSIVDSDTTDVAPFR